MLGFSLAGLFLVSISTQYYKSTGAGIMVSAKIISPNLAVIIFIGCLFIAASGLVITTILKIQEELENIDSKKLIWE
jgi:hypothetical protein